MKGNDVDDLMVWLRAQIAEIERTACAAHPGPWEWSDRGWEGRLTADEPSFHRILTLKQADIQDSEVDLFHIEANDPRTVLAQCEADTAFLDRYERANTENHSPDAYGLADDLLRARALAYRHRPGYREEWRP